MQQLQEAQARRNAASKEIGQAKAKKDDDAAKRLMGEVAGLKSAIQEGEEGAGDSSPIQEGEAGEKRLDDELKTILAAIPNTPAAEVPVGPDAGANVE